MLLSKKLQVIFYFALDFFYIIPNLKQNRTNVGLNKQIQKTTKTGKQQQGKEGSGKLGR